MSASTCQRLLIVVTLISALAARVIVFTPFGVHHADEAFQYLEQAYRLVFGTSIVPWEYRYGMRSWLVPLALAGPMWLGEVIAPGTMLYIILPRALIAVIAASAMWSAWVIGARISRWHGWAAFAGIALWFESVFFSVHVLTETMASASVLAAVALIDPRPDTQRPAGRLMGAGALLALGAVLRFHYLPAIGVLALFLLRTDWRAWGWAAAGGASVLLVSGGVDLAMGQIPFGWIVENFRQNVLFDRASGFGTLGPSSYPLMWVVQWKGAFAFVALLAIMGARRLPLLMAVALVNVIVHTLIGHKEYRFIWLSTQLIVLLAGIGTVDALAFLTKRFAVEHAHLAIGAGVAWAATSLALAPGSAMLHLYGNDSFALANRLSRSGACGIILTGTNYYWLGGGRAFVHGGNPALYYVNDQVDLAAMTRRVSTISTAADGILAPPGLVSLPRGYHSVGCGESYGKPFCAYRRAGGCRSIADADRSLLQRVLIHNDL